MTLSAKFDEFPLIASAALKAAKTLISTEEAVSVCISFCNFFKLILFLIIYYCIGYVSTRSHDDS